MAFYWLEMGELGPVLLKDDEEGEEEEEEAGEEEEDDIRSHEKSADNLQKSR